MLWLLSVKLPSTSDLIGFHSSRDLSSIIVCQILLQEKWMDLFALKWNPISSSYEQSEGFRLFIWCFFPNDTLVKFLSVNFTKIIFFKMIFYSEDRQLLPPIHCKIFNHFLENNKIKNEASEYHTGCFWPFENSFVEYWIRFKWNKHRCTYVHLKNLF